MHRQSPIRRQSKIGNRKPVLSEANASSIRQRQAARRNVVKAQKAWMQLLRDPHFSLSPETLLKIWQGLVNAVRWHLTDCSARYASNFRDGIFAISLVRSLAAAGEVLADYLRHVRDLVWAFTGNDEFLDRSSLIVAHDPEPSGDNHERRSTNHDPRSADNGQPTNDREPPPSIEFTLASGLAQVSWRRLRASRAHAAWERRAVVRLFRVVASERKRGQAITPERLTWLAEDLHKVLFYSAARFALQVRRLNRRFEALAERLLQELGLPPMPLHVRPSLAVELATTYELPEALGNPDRNPARVKAALTPRQPRVKSTEKWQRTGEPGEARRRRAEERELKEALADRYGNFIPGAFRRRLESEADPPAVASSADGQADAAPPATLDRQQFFDLVAQALGANPRIKPGQRDAIPGGLAEALWNRLEFSRGHAERERVAFRALLDDYCNSLDNCRLTIDDLRLKSSSTSGARLEESSSALLSAALEEPGDTQSSIENRQSSIPDNRQSAIPKQSSIVKRQSSISLTALATALVLLLRSDDDDLRLTAAIVKFRAQVWIWLMLIRRGVPRGEIVLLQPEPPMDSAMLDRMDKLSHSRDPEKRAESDRLLAKHARLADEWLRWKPVIESGDLGRLLSGDEANPTLGFSELIAQLERPERIERSEK